MLLHIESWVHAVYIFLIQLFPQELAGFSKTLEMHNFPLPEEFDHIIHIRVVTQTQNVVIGYPCLLLWTCIIITNKSEQKTESKPNFSTNIKLSRTYIRNVFLIQKELHHYSTMIITYEALQLGL